MKELNTRLRRVLLCELITGQKVEYVTDRLRNGDEEPLRIREKGYYLCVTGFPKRVYTGIYQKSVEWYVDIYRQFAEHMLAQVEEWGFECELVMNLYSPQKELCLMFSPKVSCTVPAFAVAEHAAQYLDEKVCTCFGDRNCRNFTALSGPLSGYEQLASGFSRLFERRDTAFFDMRCIVADDGYLSRMRKVPDTERVSRLVREIEMAFRSANSAAVEELLDKLMLGEMKRSYDFFALEEALLPIKACYRQAVQGYGLEEAEDLNRRFQPLSHVSIETMNEWLKTLLLEAIRQMAACGEHLGLLTQRAMRMIHQDYAAPALSLTTLAQRLGVSPGYLSRIFNRETGMSIPETIEKSRLEQACRLLEEGRLRICEISRAVGFSDQRYFSRVFRMYYGMTPSMYQNRCKEEE